MIYENITLLTDRTYANNAEIKELFENFHITEQKTGKSDCFENILEEFLKSFYFELLSWQTELTAMPTCPGFWARDFTIQESFYGFTIEEKFDSL